MFHLLLLLNVFLLAQSEIFISEIAESTSSTNSYIEIYNGSDQTIDLSQYSIKITRSTGNEYLLQLDDNSGDSFNDSGLLISDHVLLIVRSDSGDLCGMNDPYLQCEANGVQFIEWSSISSFNGDDSIELFHNSDLIDMIGIPGIDPGAGWSVAGIEDATRNHTLIRKPSVYYGNIDWTASAGTNAEDSEWLVFDVNTFIFGGFHNQNNDNITYEFGCMDVDACNYNSNATFPDNSCEYPEFCDCEGNPLEGFCDCFGSTFFDECGVCGGFGQFTCNTDDSIEVCDANDCPPDCAGVNNGTAFVDMCDNCIDEFGVQCWPDCNDVWGGEAYYDTCNVCDDNPLNDCIEDCFEQWGGNAIIDDCDVCGGDNTSCVLTGDINDDNQLNVVDVILLVDIIIYENGSFITSLYDINSDFDLNVVDVIELINLILDGESLIFGCMDIEACNYSSFAQASDDSCIYRPYFDDGPLEYHCGDIIFLTELAQYNNIPIPFNDVSNLGAQNWDPSFLGQNAILRLSSLSIFDSNIFYIPASIRHLDRIETLILYGNQIEILPQGIGDLVNLKFLHLYDNQISILPDEIIGLENLEILYLSYNNINTIPNNICNLSENCLIDLDYNKLCNEFNFECFDDFYPQYQTDCCEDENGISNWTNCED